MVDERARRAYELTRQIADLAEAAEVMPLCERMDILRSLEAKEEALRLLLRQPPLAQYSPASRSGVSQSGPSE